MGAIQPIDLPESTLIIGTNFPTQDETAYAREANAQRIAAEHAAGAGAVAYDSARYTNEAFQGEAGGSLAATLTRHHQTLSADQARHSNVASWLELGAQNIIHTKTAMNQISSDYHNAYEQMCQRAQAETWPQRLLSNGKDELVTESQNRVRAAPARRSPPRSQRRNQPWRCAAGCRGGVSDARWRAKGCPGVAAGRIDVKARPETPALYCRSRPVRAPELSGQAAMGGRI